jgi:hypothetical protein
MIFHRVTYFTGTCSESFLYPSQRFGDRQHETVNCLKTGAFLSVVGIRTFLSEPYPEICTGYGFDLLTILCTGTVPEKVFFFQINF